MKSFLNQYDLRGKTVIPFNTNAGYGVGSSLETIKLMCSNGEILNRISLTGGIERDGILFAMDVEKETQAREEVKKWLDKLKLINQKYECSLNASVLP
jgi:hypothetical protein